MKRKLVTVVAALASLSALFAAGCASNSSRDAPYSLTGHDDVQRRPDDLDARREAARGNYPRPHASDSAVPRG
jgi:hypothetical protein